MKSEKIRYKISSFRAVDESDPKSDVIVILSPERIVKHKKREVSMMDMMNNPFGMAQKMISQQMNMMIHDSFTISRNEYNEKKYMVGEIVIVTIERES